MINWCITWRSYKATLRDERLTSCHSLILRACYAIYKFYAVDHLRGQSDFKFLRSRFWAHWREQPVHYWYSNAYRRTNLILLGTRKLAYYTVWLVCLLRCVPNIDSNWMRIQIYDEPFVYFFKYLYKQVSLFKMSNFFNECEQKSQLNIQAKNFALFMMFLLVCSF